LQRATVPPDLLVAHRPPGGADARHWATYGGRYFPPADIARLFDNLAIYVLPCANPDGRHFVQTSDPMWRKNRNRAHGSGGSSCGADLTAASVPVDHAVKFAADSMSPHPPTRATSRSIAATDPLRSPRRAT
jgi:hypothetical protein